MAPPLEGAVAPAIIPYCDSGACQDTPLLPLGPSLSMCGKPLLHGLEADSPEVFVFASSRVCCKTASVSVLTLVGGVVRGEN